MTIIPEISPVLERSEPTAVALAVEGLTKRFGALVANDSIDFELRADFKEFASATRSLTVFDKRLDAIVNLKLEPKKDEGQK